MKNTKSENVQNFERQTLGTILTIVDFAFLIAGILILIGLFLPICEVKLVDKSITIFDFDDNAIIGVIMNLLIVLVSIGGKSLITHFRNNALDEKVDKRFASQLILLISIVSLLLTIIFVAINLPVTAISSSHELSDNLFITGTGTILIYIGAILVAVENSITALFYFAILNDKIKIENLNKIININAPKK